MSGYIRKEDREEYRRFFFERWGEWGSQLLPAPPEIWHYTNADGLIGILKSGCLYATQVSCLNDSLEQKYFGDLVLEEIEKQHPNITDPNLQILFETALAALRNRDFSAAGKFATCFSESVDDLGQWRGYGGGECGYAIGFRTGEILQAISMTALLVPMEYGSSKHNDLVTQVVDSAKKFFLAGINRSIPDSKIFAAEFLDAFAMEFDLFASVIKHPKFSGEKEHRVVYSFGPGDHSKMEFRQKRTLLARYLPLNFTVAKDGGQKLPISRVYVGPGPAKQVSKISVGDLLVKYGYPNVPVELSIVPYRLP